MNDEMTLEAVVERLNRLYSDELAGDGENPGGYDITLDVWNDGRSYRFRVGPASLDDGSWVRDLGPIFQTESQLRTFAEGIEKAKEIDRLASPV